MGFWSKAREVAANNVHIVLGTRRGMELAAREQNWRADKNKLQADWYEAEARGDTLTAAELKKQIDDSRGLI